MALVAKTGSLEQGVHQLRAFEDQAASLILDKKNEIRLALVCMIARGHLLIEDQPGMGKTTLVKVLAKLLDLKFNRIQFTNDMLPSDILGSVIFAGEGSNRQFEFRKGPIFAELILADELNRATPKTQSACLQAMEEYQVSIDGMNHPLPHPFFVVATQNPRQSIGTFPLPESQLDRFMMKISLGLPSREAERKLLQQERRDEMLEDLKPIMRPEQLVKMQDAATKVHLSENVLDYLQNLVATARTRFQSLSPRAVLSMSRAARAHAYIEGRDYVVPEDIAMIAVPAMNHRLNAIDDPYGLKSVERAQSIVKDTVIPL